MCVIIIVIICKIIYTFFCWPLTIFNVNIRYDIGIDQYHFFNQMLP